ncbi:MAG: HD domain-containing protein [Candidatus Gracilibacteria bacterium]|nr:HD domain-containing protein [Candidatus Gracilibacteria bacterium]
MMDAKVFVEHIYKGKKRRTGDPFVSHPYAVQALLRNAGVDDEEVLTAALLHDILEDTDLSKSYLAFRFGLRIADIVEMLSKQDFWTTDFCKMKSNMDEMEIGFGHHPEAVVIKMADRLHNLQTIEGFKPKKQQEYLYESTEVLMPVFDRCCTIDKLSPYHQVMLNLKSQLNDTISSLA